MRVSGGRQLKWCAGHDEPAIVYHDGSWSCRWQLIVDTSDESDCEIVALKHARAKDAPTVETIEEDAAK